MQGLLCLHGFMASSSVPLAVAMLSSQGPFSSGSLLPLVALRTRIVYSS